MLNCSPVSSCVKSQDIWVCEVTPGRCADSPTEDIGLALSKTFVSSYKMLGHLKPSQSRSFQANKHQHEQLLTSKEKTKAVSLHPLEPQRSQGFCPEAFICLAKG